MFPRHVTRLKPQGSQEERNKPRALKLGPNHQDPWSLKRWVPAVFEGPTIRSATGCPSDGAEPFLRFTLADSGHATVVDDFVAVRDVRWKNRSTRPWHSSAQSGPWQQDKQRCYTPNCKDDQRCGCIYVSVQIISVTNATK